MDTAKMETSLSENINVLGHFCGQRDIPFLNQESLQKKYGFSCADVMVFFGGSILAGGDTLAEAMNNHVAEKYIIVGGAGHTTETLRAKVREEYSSINSYNISEAEIFQEYLYHAYGLRADYLETLSTNCGNNITFLLNLLQNQRIKFHSIILIQDATMQKRMDAGLRKYVPEQTQIINYAAYSVQIHSENGTLLYNDNIHGMWEIDRYINLLMGEIPRLTDDINGYGPNGKGFIAHVDIPPHVKKAFETLRITYGENIREANPMFS